MKHAATFLAAAMLVAITGSVVAADRRPNIVFILADDLGYGDVTCYNGESKVPTPHIDRLAAAGIRFTDAYTPAAVCVPTRYNLLTGRYAFRNTIRSGALLEPGRMTLASLLQDNGYFTACVGKWHLGFDGGVNHADRRRLPGGPVDRGFNTYFGLHASLDIPPYFYIRDDYAVEPPTIDIPDQNEPGYSLIYQGRFWRAGKISHDFNHDEVLDRLTDEAVEVLKARRKSGSDRPFFLYFPMTAPHGPWVPGEAFQGKSQCGPYGDFLLHVDHAVGRVLNTINQLGYADNTLVIFTSDNGPLWTDADNERFGHRAAHHLRGRKGDIWEGGVRVPFIARWPGRIPAGSTSSQVLALTDMLATFAAILGQSLPHDAGEDSFNLLGAMLDPSLEAPIRPSLIVQSGGPQRTAIRCGRWKFIPWLGPGGFLTEPTTVEPQPAGPKGQLYDLLADPGETQNVFLQHPKIVEELSALLKAVREEGRTRPGAG
jgi:arylsulfatase A